jgi:hypothetical protein
MPWFEFSMVLEAISIFVIGYKFPNSWGYNWATLLLDKINTGTWPL